MDNVTNPEVILSVKNLVKDFPIGQSAKSNLMRAVNDVTFELRKGEALAIVGESGSGKSTGARVLTRIYDKTDGEVTFKGQELGEYIQEHGELEYARQVQMIFQDPFGSLNPVHTHLPPYCTSASDPQTCGKRRDSKAGYDCLSWLACLR